MGVARKRVKTWLDLFAAECEAGLRYRSSRPHTMPARTAAEVEWRIVELRHRERRGPDWIGAELGVPPRTSPSPPGQPGCHAEGHAEHQEADVDEHEGGGLDRDVASLINQPARVEVAGLVPDHQDEPAHAPHAHQRPGPGQGAQHRPHDRHVAPRVHQAKQDHHSEPKPQPKASTNSNAEPGNAGLNLTAR